MMSAKFSCFFAPSPVPILSGFVEITQPCFICTCPFTITLTRDGSDLKSLLVELLEVERGQLFLAHPLGLVHVPPLLGRGQRVVQRRYRLN